MPSSRACPQTLVRSVSQRRTKKDRSKSTQQEIAEGLDPSLLPGLTFGDDLLAPKPWKGVDLSHMAGGEGLVVDDDGLIVIQEEHYKQMVAGYRCFACHERQESAFPVRCSLCGYEMRRLQSGELAADVVERRHLGPTPVNDDLEELENMRLMREFDDKIKAGKSPMRGLRRA